MIHLKETDQQKVYFTTDPHLGHNPKWPVPLWKSRGYNSVIEHDNAIIDGINSIVRPNDILFILGDFCLNSTVDQFESYIARIYCQNLWCLWGNHNNPHEKQIYRKTIESVWGSALDVPDEISKNSPDIYPLKYKNMTYLGHYQEVVVNGYFIVLFHYPISVWNNVKQGAWHLCGHSHNGFITSQEASTSGKILDVSWDGHKKPWSMDELVAVMSKKQIVQVDSHH